MIAAVEAANQTIWVDDRGLSGFAGPAFVVFGRTSVDRSIKERQ
jgi:hypothetical protein